MLGLILRPGLLYKEAGQFKIELNTSQLAAGIYYYTLETAQSKETKRLMVVK
jgi:hypothetical protein